MSFYNDQDAADWRYIEPAEMWYRGVNQFDIRPEDSREDFVKKGYWIKMDTPTAVVLSLKGCQFLNSWTQSRI